MRSLKYAAALATLFASLVAIAPAARALSVKPTIANFGTVALEKTKTKSISIKLDAGYELNAIIGGGGPWSENLGTCTPTSVKCKATVFFEPTGVGVYDSTLTMRECTPTFSCQDSAIALHGVGGLLRATPVHVDFGSVAANSEKAKSVSIRVDPGFHLNSVGTTGGPFPENLGNCTATSTKCKASVFFAPISTGTFDGTFIVKECDPAANCDSYSITLHGVGV
jgi:hypothetical protein